MKRCLMVLLLLSFLLVKSHAAELPKELTDALPERAEAAAGEITSSGIQGFLDGISRIFDEINQQAEGILRQRIRGAVSILLVVIFCAAAEGFAFGLAGKASTFLPMAGALSVTMLAAGDIESLIGLGAETIGELSRFSKVLFPTLAAATAASGAVTTAALHQVTTVFLVDLLLSLIDGVLMPMVYLYIGILTASACMQETRLEAIATGLKEALLWVMKTSLLLFTVYLSAARVISGAVDGTTVKMTKTVISSVVPLVGSIISDAAETVLAGAGILKNTIGIFGMLAIFGACIYPFLQLGIQYLLYKLTAFLAAAIGAPWLCKLIRGLGGAFGLVLGMTGSCALLMLVSVLSSVAMVTP